MHRGTHTHMIFQPILMHYHGSHVAQILFLHIKSLGNQSMYKNGRMISHFFQFLTLNSFGGMFATEKV